MPCKGGNRREGISGAAAGNGIIVVDVGGSAECPFRAKAAPSR